MAAVILKCPSTKVRVLKRVINVPTRPLHLAQRARMSPRVTIPLVRPLNASNNATLSTICTTYAYCTRFKLLLEPVGVPNPVPFIKARRITHVALHASCQSTTPMFHGVEWTALEPTNAVIMPRVNPKAQGVCPGRGAFAHYLNELDALATAVRADSSKNRKVGAGVICLADESRLD